MSILSEVRRMAAAIDAGAVSADYLLMNEITGRLLLDELRKDRLVDRREVERLWGCELYDMTIAFDPTVPDGKVVAASIVTTPGPGVAASTPS